MTMLSWVTGWSKPTHSAQQFSRTKTLSVKKEPRRRRGGLFCMRAGLVFRLYKEERNYKQRSNNHVGDPPHISGKVERSNGVEDDCHKYEQPHEPELVLLVGLRCSHESCADDDPVHELEIGEIGDGRQSTEGHGDCQDLEPVIAKPCLHTRTLYSTSLCQS